MVYDILDGVGVVAGVVWIRFWWTYIGRPVYWPAVKMTWLDIKENLTGRQ